MLGLRKSTHEGRPLVSEYDGRQFVGIDLHRRRTVIVRHTESGEQLDCVRITNDPLSLAREIGKAGPAPEVVLEATYGWGATRWAACSLPAVAEITGLLPAATLAA
jgi:hypothetical protein